MTAGKVTVVDHPLVQHKLTLMRDVTTPTGQFRQLMREVSFLLAYEVCREFDTERVPIQTPLEAIQGVKLKGKKTCIITVMRAGNGLLDGMLDLIPSARVGHVGLYRDHKTLEAVEYYLKFPDQMKERVCIIVDPMLATGNSAIEAVRQVKIAGATRIIFMCLLASPEGIKNFERKHPDVPIYTAAIDRELNELGYILPGLGDAGDRMFGTK